VLSYNGQALRAPGELRHLPLGAPVTLDLDSGQIEVTPIPTIAEIPYDSENLVPQALLAKLEKQAKYDPDPLIRNSARFNQARFQFFLGDNQKAFDIFSTLVLDTQYGINQGTLFYYQALCFRRLKLAGEATDALRRVLDYPNATLFDAYGPKAAEWAEAELAAPNL
jgi:hypothetical protein